MPRCDGSFHASLTRASRRNLSQSILMRSARSGAGGSRATPNVWRRRDGPSGLRAAPVPQAAHEQERSGFFRIGQIVARGARKALDQRLLVAFVVRLKRDRGDDDKNPLFAAVVGLRG